MFTRDLPSIPESVSHAVELAESAGRDAGLSDRVISRIGLAVAEAVANAIEHGNENDATREVRLTITPEAPCLSVYVSDNGRGISVERIQTAQLPDDVLQSDGRGLYLIRELTDRVETRGNEIRLWFCERS